MPPIEGWWIMTRECGKASRLPFAPPTSSREPIEAARPTLIVETSALTCRMVSNIAKPAVTEPPGLLMYMYIGLLLSCVFHQGHASGCRRVQSRQTCSEAGGELRTSESRYSMTPMIWFAMSSEICCPRKTMRSRYSLL